MKSISERQLRNAVDRAGLTPDIFERIRTALSLEPEISPSFEIAHIAYYLGGLLIIGAMGWFITSAWDRLSGVTLTAIAVAYGAIFGYAGRSLFRKPATRVPGGVLLTVAVCMTPLAVYGIERVLGWWPGDNPGGYSRFHPYIDAGWVVMEIATIAVAAATFRFAKVTFLTAPAAYALWYLSMDATALIFGRHWTFHEQCWISAGFGLGMIVIAYLLEERTEIDLSFWFYLFGLLAFTGGLSAMGNGKELGKAVYCLLHLTMILLSIILQRRVFLVFGAVGVFAYLVGEAQGFFRDSLSFTFFLTVLGILFILAGLSYKKNEAELTHVLHPLIPRRIRERHSAAMTV